MNVPLPFFQNELEGSAEFYSDVDGLPMVRQADGSEEPARQVSDVLVFGGAPLLNEDDSPLV